MMVHFQVFKQKRMSCCILHFRCFIRYRVHIELFCIEFHVDFIGQASPEGLVSVRVSAQPWLAS